VGKRAEGRRSVKDRDFASIFAFATFWVVIAIGCWLGLRIVHAMGWTGTDQRSSQPAPAISTAHGSVSHLAPPQLSLASIFAPQPVSLAGYDQRKIRTLIATGDVIPARTVNYKMVTSNDFTAPFRPTAAYLRTADMTLINLESPLIGASCRVANDTTMTFCGDPRFVQGLQLAGVDTACTANNHIGNYGNEGIQETWSHLRAAHIGFCGYGSVDHKTIRSLRFAFLAFNCVGNRFDYTLARRQIDAEHRAGNVVIVSVHWGKEYVALPQAAPGVADDDPQRVAHWIIDSGADLIIGNHPHHVQGVEWYHHRLITYAHGNFIFDQMFPARECVNTSDHNCCPGDGNRFCSTREGVVGAYTFYGRQLVRVRYRPVVIYDWWQPRWADPATARIIMQHMQAATQQLSYRHG